MFRNPFCDDIVPMPFREIKFQYWREYRNGKNAIVIARKPTASEDLERKALCKALTKKTGII